jgi:hypothetical protein
MKYLLIITLTAFHFALAAEPAEMTSARANALRTKFSTLEQPLRQNQFKRPLVLNSQETLNNLKGDIYAILDFSLNTVSSELNNPAHWCDVMLMHNNTKYCHATANTSDTLLTVYIGKKTPEELRRVAHIDFNFHVVAITPEYFQIQLNAKKGPMGTSDYLILLEAVELSHHQTLMHLTYSYSMSFSGRLAIMTYLNTIGRGKVGFTMTDKQSNGQLDYIDGVRGLVERNTMRYYLAIDSFLGAAKAPTEAAQLEKRLQSWFSAVEQYPRQLHEMDRNDYMTMKRAENIRQQSVH